MVKNRNLRDTQITGEAAIEDTKTAAGFPSIIEQRNYPELIFNVNATTISRKRIPTHTFFSRGENRTSGFKAATDHLT